MIAILKTPPLVTKMTKVIFKDNRPTKTISLPAYEGSELVIYASPLIGDIEGIDPKQSELSMGIKTMPKLIKSWNFTDETGVDLPITEESIRKLTAEDVAFISKAINEFSAEVKKN